MSTRLREREERIRKIIECLVEESAKGALVIVEGKKDVETLRTLGVKGEIVSAKTGGKSRFDVISEVQEAGVSEAILLLDFDRRGREWTKILKQHLENTKVKPDLTFWSQLLRFAGRELKDIEGLAAYMETLKRKSSS